MRVPAPTGPLILAIGALAGAGAAAAAALMN
jgi:hypothetical protein